MTPADNFPEQLKTGMALYDGDAHLRTSVAAFRPTLSPDGHGGSTTSLGTSFSDVVCDPVSQEYGQTLIYQDEDSAADLQLRVGDIVRIQHSQFAD